MPESNMHPTEANRRTIRQASEDADTEQFVREVLTPFGARFSSTEPFRPVKIREIYADRDTVIAMWDGRGIAKAGPTRTAMPGS